MGKKVYLLMDVDGTLIRRKDGKPANTWKIMLELLGYDVKESEEFAEKYRKADEKERRKIIEGWMRHDLGLIESKYSENDLLTAMKMFYYTPGTSTLIDYARNRGWRVGLISAGFTPLVEKIAEELGVEIALSIPIRYENNRFVYDKIVDAEEKAKKVREIKKAGYAVVYVGDGPNDWKAMKEADLAICIGKCYVGNAVVVEDFFKAIDVLKEFQAE